MLKHIFVLIGLPLLVACQPTDTRKATATLTPELPDCGDTGRNYMEQLEMRIRTNSEKAEKELNTGMSLWLSDNDQSTCNLTRRELDALTAKLPHQRLEYIRLAESFPDLREKACLEESRKGTSLITQPAPDWFLEWHDWEVQYVFASMEATHDAVVRMDKRVEVLKSRVRKEYASDEVGPRVRDEL